MERHASIEQPDNFGWTPLFWSTFKGHQETTRLLLSRGASKRAIDSSRWTPLHWAACKGDKAMIQILNVDSIRENSWSLTNKWNIFLAKALRPFFLAAEGNNVESLDALVLASGQSTLMPQRRLNTGQSRGADVKDETLQERNKILYRVIGKERNYTCGPLPTHPSIALPKSFLLQLLDSAVHANHLDLVRIVLERDLDLATGSYGELKGRSILHTAAFCTDARIPSLLLQRGAGTLQIDEDGYHPLDLAALNGSEPVIRVFMQEPNAKQAIAKSQMLMHAIWENRNLLGHIQNLSSEDTDDAAEQERRTQTLLDTRLALADELVSLGANYTARHHITGGTVPHSAIDCGIAAVDFLVSLKVDTNAQNDYGRTALHLALDSWRFGALQQQLMTRLLTLGADCNIQDENGQPPMFVAFRRRLFDLAKLLIEKGAAKTNLRDKWGHNCLHELNRTYQQRDGTPGIASFVQYLADASELGAAVERCHENGHGGKSYPFEIGFADARGLDQSVRRALFERALQADRKLIEAHLADDTSWTEGIRAWEIGRAAERQTYLEWTKEVDRGETIFKNVGPEAHTQGRNNATVTP